MLAKHPPTPAFSLLVVVRPQPPKETSAAKLLNKMGNKLRKDIALEGGSYP